MYKPQKIVIEELRELFEVEKNLKYGTIESNGLFMISKKQMQRFDVIELLRTYFYGVGVKDGYLIVDPITFVHTTFTVRNGTPEELE